MTAQADPYVRVYYRIIDDPKFSDVFDDDATLALWVRLLLSADAMYPAPAPLPRRLKDAALKKLVAAGLIDLLPGDRFRMHGLAAEREQRSQQASASAKLRWNRPREEGGKRPSRGTRFKVLQRDGFTCRYCGGKPPDVVLDVDHIKPFREGGQDDLDNLVAACVECNMGKSGHSLSDARASTTDMRAHKPTDALRTTPIQTAPLRNGLKPVVEEEPFVTLTDVEKAARRQKDRDELMARTMERLGVKP